MTDKILSPDGKQEWNGTEWVPLSGHSTAPGTESIVNYAELCVDALNRGENDVSISLGLEFTRVYYI
tara:strand:- start:304 stop:504 length:201 start_codon:yes stop_codon:yes gene_type:complete